MFIAFMAASINDLAAVGGARSDRLGPGQQGSSACARVSGSQPDCFLCRTERRRHAETRLRHHRLFIVDKIVPIDENPEAGFHENAHTRRMMRANADDVVVLAKAGRSGRTAVCVLMREYRARASRNTESLLAASERLSTNDGGLRRNAMFPSFMNPTACQDWWSAHKVELVGRTN